MIEDKSGDEVALYLLWNDGIFAHFFNAQKANQGVRLTFDETNLDAVAEKIGLQAPTFVRSVGQLLRLRSTNLFAKFEDLRAREREIPATVGLLAAQVFVASNMRADDKASGANFWLRFNDMLLHSDSRQPPDGYEQLGAFWRDLVAWLNVRNAGHLGILRVPGNPAEAPLQGRVHINYPLSQCLVRETDRQELAYFFATNPRAQECPVSNLVDVVAGSQYGFSKAFSEVLRQAEHGGGYRDELNQTLVEIRLSAVMQVEKVIAGSGAVHRRIRTRLKMRKDRGENVVVLQRLAVDWQDVMILSADEWRNGVSEDDAAAAPWKGARRSIFVDGDDGFITSAKLPEGPARLRVLYDGAFYEPSSAISSLSSGVVELSEDLAGLTCIQIALPGDTDEKVLSEIGLHTAAGRSAIHLGGGLSLGRRRYIRGAAPSIVVEGMDVEVSVDGRFVNIPADGIIAAKDTPSEVGIHVVLCGEDELPYEIVDLSEASDSNEGGTIGYAISFHPAILRSVDLSRVNDDKVPGLKHLVGADLT